jgi:hypothetical protein
VGVPWPAVMRELSAGRPVPVAYATLLLLVSWPGFVVKQITNVLQLRSSSTVLLALDTPAKTTRRPVGVEPKGRNTRTTTTTTTTTASSARARAPFDDSGAYSYPEAHAHTYPDAHTDANDAHPGVDGGNVGLAESAAIDPHVPDHDAGQSGTTTNAAGVDEWSILFVLIAISHACVRICACVRVCDGGVPRIHIDDNETNRRAQNI